MALLLPPVYPITDKRISGRPTHLAILKELVRGGATLVQIRDKETEVRELLTDLRRCVEFSAKHGVSLMVNDRCDLALCSGADGIHLGQDDLPPAAARRILGPGSLIGYSTHTLGQARKSKGLPIDYLAFGPIYTTATKQDAASVVGLSKLRKVCAGSSLPVVAIGGIDLNRLREVLDAGAHSAAVISALMSARNIALRMEEFLTKATATR
jgi:thiamine-phosphate pyrophosphorylase